MKRLRTALLGLAGPGDAYHRALVADDQFQLVAVGETNAHAPSRHAIDPSMTIYGDYRSLIVETAAAGLDLLVVTLEPGEALRYVTLAAGRGVNVCCQPPYARGVDEAREIIRCFKEHRVALAAPRLWRFDPALAPLRAGDHPLGRVHTVCAFVTLPEVAGEPLPGAYEPMDLLIGLFGLPETVYAQATALPAERDVRAQKGGRSVSMTLRFADDLVGSVVIAKAKGGPGWNVILVGSDASASIGPAALRLDHTGAGVTPAASAGSESLSRALSVIGAELLSGAAKVSGAAADHLATIATIEAAALSIRTASPESPGRLLG